MKQHTKHNIDKAQFNEYFRRYMAAIDRPGSESYFELFIYPHLDTIIFNACYHWGFEDPCEREEIYSDITETIWRKIKTGKLDKYKGNFYNVIFTIARNRLYDLMRSKEVRNRRRETISNLSKEISRTYSMPDPVVTRTG